MKTKSNLKPEIFPLKATLSGNKYLGKMKPVAQNKPSLCVKSRPLFLEGGTLRERAGGRGEKTEK